MSCGGRLHQDLRLHSGCSTLWPRPDCLWSAASTAVQVRSVCREHQSVLWGESRQRRHHFVEPARNAMYSCKMAAYLRPRSTRQPATLRVTPSSTPCRDGRGGGACMHTASDAARTCVEIQCRLGGSPCWSRSPIGRVGAHGEKILKLRGDQPGATWGVGSESAARAPGNHSLMGKRSSAAGAAILRGMFGSCHFVSR